MSVDLELERLYSSVELVRGMGNPRKARLCIMSLVAYLAGEGHGDRPRTASRLIRDFAVSLNDLAPSEWRQELKPFAPRIIGTNDGHDPTRAKIMYRTIMREVIPKASADAGPANDGYREDPDHFAIRHPLGMGIPSDVARWAASLLGILIRNAPSTDSQRWYWVKALKLLDRLCDVGAEERWPDVRRDRIEQMHEALERRRAAEERVRNLVNDAKKMAREVPRLCRTMVRHIV